MFGGILFRMIVRELIKVFVLCLLSITGILLLAGIVAEASQQGLGPGQILAVIPLLIPSTLPYTIPATTLFASCVVYGRLAHDNEILAIRASGVNVTRIVWPGILLGLVMSGVTMGLYYELIPSTHHLMRSMFLKDVEELLYTMLRRHNQINYPNFDYSIYVRGVQGRRLVNPTFKRRNPDGNPDVVAQAREAELRVDMARKLVLVHMRHGVAWSEGNTSAFFDDRIWEVPLPDDIVDGGDKYRRARDLTWREVLERRETFRADYAKVTQDLADLGERPAGGSTAEAEAEWAASKELLTRQERLLRITLYSFDCELQMRPALSMGCLFFVLVGCPVGIWFSKSDYLSSFITCFLPIVLVYYPLLLCGTGMAKDGKFGPVLTIWAADAVVGLIGLVLFHRLLRH